MSESKVIKITENVYWVGVNDDQKQLFESLWSLPFGISYNSYLIIGEEKTALVDLVEKSFTEKLVEKINSIFNIKKLDYIILNHLEPDHTGALKDVTALAKDAKIVLSKIGIPILKGFYNDIKNEIIPIKDGDSLSLGKKTINFIQARFLHWPETIFSYLEEDGILFSCDAFGSYGILDNGIFDDELDLSFYEKEAKRYFANIVSKYAKFVIKAIDKLNQKGIKPKIIAPSHGPIYRSNPEFIISKYYKWSLPEYERKVVIVYGSMYGNTRQIAIKLKELLENEGISTVLFDSSYDDVSFMLREVLDSPAIVFGVPTYDVKMFPKIKYITDLIVSYKDIKGRIAAIFGSYGWGGGAIKELRAELEKNNFRIIEPIIQIKGAPRQEHFKEAEILAKNLIQEIDAFIKE